MSGERAVLATPWLLARMSPNTKGESLPCTGEQQFSFWKVGHVGPLPTLALLDGEGVGWGVRFREVTLGPVGVFVQGGTRAHMCASSSLLCSRECGLGEADWKDSLIME